MWERASSNYQDEHSSVVPEDQQEGCGGDGWYQWDESGGWGVTILRHERRQWR